MCRAWCFMKMSWKSVHPFLHNITNRHGSRKYINGPMIQGVNHNIPKMFQFAPCVMSVVVWEFHENPVNRFSAMLLKAWIRPKKVEKIPCSNGKVEHPENGPNYSSCHGYISIRTNMLPLHNLRLINFIRTRIITNTRQHVWLLREELMHCFILVVSGLVVYRIQWTRSLFCYDPSLNHSLGNNWVCLNRV